MKKVITVCNAFLEKQLKVDGKRFCSIPEKDLAEAKSNPGKYYKKRLSMIDNSFEKRDNKNSLTTVRKLMKSVDFRGAICVKPFSHEWFDDLEEAEDYLLNNPLRYLVIHPLLKGKRYHITKVQDSYESRYLGIEVIPESKILWV